ncbi:lanthionine synthetase LanC family protein [Streptomyces sp. NPDC001494]
MSPTTRGRGRRLAEQTLGRRAHPDALSGTAGIVPVLLEAWRHFGDDSYADTALRAARGIADRVDGMDDDSLYFGRTGMALVLRAVHDELGDTAAGAAADRAPALVRSRFDGTRWGELFELMGGNAGIGLGALVAGDAELAVLAVEPYLRTAERTPAGVQWAWRTDTDSRLHHVSHGTLGIALALARVGRAVRRADLVELALAGAADVTARDEAPPEGFLVPHSTPRYRPDVIDPVSYGWCHGPAGDAQAFRLLRDVTADPGWADLADRCWHTVAHSGLPRRLPPASGTTAAAAAAPRACSPWPATGSPNSRAPTTSPTSSSRTSPPARSGTPAAPAGPTSSTGRTRATSNRAPAGRWATRASSANSCASYD